MSFFRNPEIKSGLLLFLLAGIIASALGFIIDLSSGLLALSLSVVFTFLHFILTYKRYNKIAKLSREIDNMLSGNDAIDLGDYSEGELAILQSQIFKLTVQLREQAGILQKDKSYLADSIADISHQIRTPLTSINLLISLLSNPGTSEERRTELIKELEMLLSRIDWLISALLKMSKLDAKTASFKQEIVSVKELAELAGAPLAIPLELREQQLITKMKGDECYIGDLSWSVEALANILKNCMEHTPNGGNIVLEAVENSLYTEITITDNGSGIDKEDLPHLFERFYKGINSSDQSIGIGLALARMIISNQNGTIKAENNRDGGAKFTIRFYKGIV